MHSNSIELLGYYGGDEAHALSAWTSTGREMSDERRSQIPTLLVRLATGSDGNSHGTPFEKSKLHFLVEGDIASHIHCLKHRIGVSINGESARYREFKEDRFYVPSDWPESERRFLEEHCKVAFDKYHYMVDKLEQGGLSRSRAKESARYFLPYATQIKWDIDFNFRSFVLFMKLRNAPHAQVEIREIASTMLGLVKTQTNDAFKYSLEAFGL